MPDDEGRHALSTGHPRTRTARLHLVPDRSSDPATSRQVLNPLLDRVAKGDHDAFALLYDAVSPAVFGLARRVLRQTEQAEEVAQEVLLEIWQRAPTYDPDRGSAMTWVLTVAHRRAVDRVRSAQASTDRDRKAAERSHEIDHDHVSETVEQRLETEALRRCLDRLTQIQRQSVTLAYYGGHTYPEVALLLDTPLGTVKTRMRDGLIRLRDCLGVTA